VDKAVFHTEADAFKKHFGASPDVIVRSPGRVNIIGEHTDYLGGLCLPMAIDLGLTIAASKSKDGVLAASSLYPDIPPEKVVAGSDDGCYSRLAALLSELRDAGLDVPGARIHITGNLSAGAGLSSSAAFTVGVLTALDHLYGWELPPDRKIALAIASEHRAGTPCGWMDPAAVLYGRRGHAVLLDCLSEEHELVPIFTGDYNWIVIHSGVTRDIADGRYARLRAAMRNAAEELLKLDERLSHPRMLGFEGYMSVRDRIPDALHRYLDHFFLENERVKIFRSAFERGNVWQAGNLLYDSHDSLKRNLGTGVPETDWIIENLSGKDACIGARVTGAGFGGAVIALIEAERAPDIAKAVVSEGSAKFDRAMDYWRVTPSNGVEVAG